VIKQRQEESGLEQRDLAAGAEVTESYIPSCGPPKSATRSLRNLLTSSAGELSIAQGKGRSQITHCGLDYFMTLSVLNQNR